MSAGFKDHFSAHAPDYAAFRPHYPQHLFTWLAAQAPRLELAWDCGTGNGQAAAGLARHFRLVIATDPSQEQIDAAPALKRVEYRCESAEHSSLPDHGVDLITVAQALHWFDFTAFLQEAARVLARNACVAAWTYGLASIEPEIDRLVRTFYDGPIGPYWPAERRQVETGYRDLAFPWPAIAVPPFELSLPWACERFLAYLGTWSAVRRYRAQRGEDPLQALAPELSRAWGSGERRVRWPLKVRAFRVA